MATNPDQTSWTLGNNGFTTYDNFGMNFQGAWLISVAYSLNDVVTHNGSGYIVETAHTSSSSTEPGVGGTWTDFLSKLVNKGDTGSTGAAGNAGVDSGFTYNWLTNTSETDPTSTKIKGNNATLANITKLFISETDDDSQGIAAEIAQWDDSASTIRTKLKITGASSGDFIIFNITSTNTDNGSWVTLNGVVVDSGGTFSGAEQVKVNAQIVGDKGDTGSTGAGGATGSQGSTGPTGPVVDIFAQDAEPATGGEPNSLWIDTDSTDQDLYQLNGSTTWVDTTVNLKGLTGSTGGTGSTGATGPQGPVVDIFSQASEPSTAGEENSLWIDSDSTDLDLYQLNGSATWIDTTVNLKGLTGSTGSQGSQGNVGNTGPTGPTYGLQYNFSTTITDSDPGSGILRLNHATLASVTFIFADNEDLNAVSQTAVLDFWDDSSSSVKGVIQIIDPNDNTNHAWYKITGAVTDGTGYRKIPVTHLASNGTLPNAAEIDVLFYPKGDAGSGAVDSFESRTGAVVSNAGDYTAAEITNVATGAIEAVTVQAAIDELDTEKSATGHTHTLSAITDSGALAALATVGASQIDSNAVTTIKINANAVTLPKMADMATASFLGRNTAATGAVEVLSKATSLSVLNVADGANNYSHPNHSGEVTSTGDGATVIIDNAVTLAKTAHGTQGDILFYGSTGTPTLLGFGTSGQFLQTNGTGANPSWETASSSVGDNSITLAKLAHGTHGDILFYGSTGTPTLLGAGTSGYVLKTNGGAADPSWTPAGGTGALAFLNSVSATEIDSSAVTTIKINDLAVTTDKLAEAVVDGICKGWVKFEVDGATPIKFNVTSITDVGTGSWVVVWATDFAQEDYAVTATLGQGDDDKIIYVAAMDAGTTDIRCWDISAAALADPGGLARIFVTGIGDPA